MQPIIEHTRINSPIPKPQALAIDGGTCWISSRATKQFHAVDRATWRSTWETAASDGQTVWGATAVGGDVFVVCGVDADGVDERTIRRVRPGQGFDPQFRLACPDGLGSHLSHDGTSLVLSQWYPRKLIPLDARGQPRRVIELPHDIVGHCFARGAFWLATTTDETSPTEFFLERCDPASGHCAVVARIGFSARALAFDGERFWTNHRDADQIVSFELPR
jgi:hypothetical protein